MPDLLGGEHWPIRRLEARQLGRQPDAVKSREVSGAEDVLLRSCRLFDRDYSRVRVRAAHKRGMQCARKRNVGAKLPAAGQKALVLKPRQTCSDAETAHLRTPDTSNFDSCDAGETCAPRRSCSGTRVGLRGANLDFVPSLDYRVCLMGQCGSAARRLYGKPIELHRRMVMARLRHFAVCVGDLKDLRSSIRGIRSEGSRA